MQNENSYDVGSSKFTALDTRMCTRENTGNRYGRRRTMDNTVAKRAAKKQGEGRRTVQAVAHYPLAGLLKRDYGF